MQSKRKLIFLVLLLLIIGLYYLFQNKAKSPQSSQYTVLDVIDGDTVIIDDVRRSRVRYLGIDTPEIALQDSPGEPMSEEARNFNAGLVEGERVRLEYDEEKYDIYGRILAHVYVHGVHVNRELLKQGLATVLIIDPNRMYSENLIYAEQEAKRKKKGLWGELSGLVPPEGNSEFEVELDKAHRYEGKRVVVRGRIIDARKTDKVIVLNMEDVMDVVIYPDDWGNFKHFYIDPETFYNGKTVEVTGRVKMRRGKPGMVVSHPMLIRSPG